MISRSNANRGFSLVELMVAVVIALVAMLAAISLYSSTRQTYRIQGMQSRLSEDGRFAISMLTRVIQQAGFRTNPATSMGATIVPDATAPSSKFTVQFVGDGTNTIDCNGAAAVGAQSLVVGLSGTSLQCGTTDWIAPSGNGTEIVSFRVEYGIDTGPNTTPKAWGCGDLTATDSTKRVRDCVADSYVTTVTTSPIVAVRVCLVLRSEDTDVGVAKAAAYKDCAGTNITDSQNDRRLYRTFRSTIQLKNR